MINGKKIIIIILCLVGLFSCEKQSDAQIEKEFLNQMDDLKEFKALEKRLDSLQKEGIETGISIGVTSDPIDDEDISRNLITGFVYENLASIESLRLIVKYDKHQKKIVSVKNNME